jgi:hypothetical protein
MSATVGRVEPRRIAVPLAMSSLMTEKRERPFTHHWGTGCEDG